VCRILPLKHLLEVKLNYRTMGIHFPVSPSKQPSAQWVKIKVKVKVRVTLEEATKAQGGVEV